MAHVDSNARLAEILEMTTSNVYIADVLMPWAAAQLIYQFTDPVSCVQADLEALRRGECTEDDLATAYGTGYETESERKGWRMYAESLSFHVLREQAARAANSEPTRPRYSPWADC